MAISAHRRVRPVWVATLLLLIGLVGGPPGAGGQGATHLVERALPAAVAAVAPVGPAESASVRPDARTLLAGSWSPTQPGPFALAATAAALALPLVARRRRITRRAGRPGEEGRFQAARGPPPVLPAR
ncbi:conserved hypothetical protein [Frankia canadensis]|uniref:Uncharacterized protein n=1 Tax=Frankia canadensis TaxID=1836972 RepID=A0A2I2KMF8_9ACTN|nr:hypothetical protein [Frankia canadensis]SNQ46851.1 conserved hypothetical protein [Frankia canadensis]SOU54141.1 conserved hypothetical protein [Frankia canadensis]